MTDRDDDDDITPLHCGAINGRVEACAYLIEQGAKVNAVCGDAACHASAVGRAQRSRGDDRPSSSGTARTRVSSIRRDTAACTPLRTRPTIDWALLYILLCSARRDVDVNGEGQHEPYRRCIDWAVYQRDGKVSTQILLELGTRNPNAVDRD